jgi:hypothetical protein
MRLSFRRCACGAMLVFVAATGVAFHHDEETHTNRPTEPVAQVKLSGVASSSSSARAVQGSPMNGVWYIST